MDVYQTDKHAKKSRRSEGQLIRLLAFVISTFHLPAESQTPTPNTSNLVNNSNKKPDPDQNDQKTKTDEKANTDEEEITENSETENKTKTDEKTKSDEPAKTEDTTNKEEAADNNDASVAEDTTTAEGGEGVEGGPSIGPWAAVIGAVAAAAAVGLGLGAIENNTADNYNYDPPAPPSGPLILTGTGAQDEFYVPLNQTEVHIFNFDNANDVIDVTALGVSFADIVFFDNAIDTTITSPPGHTILLKAFPNSGLLNELDFHFSKGTAGDNILYSGITNEDMTGLAGSDTFVYLQSNDDVMITDFTLGVDKLDLTDLGLIPADVVTTTNGIHSTVHIKGVPLITLENLADPTGIDADILL